MDINLIRENEPLKNHSTFRVGGPAKYFYKAKSTDDIPELVKWADEQAVPYFVFGGGSNLLFKDEGFPGLVIKVTARNIELKDEEVIAESGAKISQVAQVSCDQGFGGIEEFAYLPGTIGGAVYGNAGCFGKEVKDVLSRAWVFDGKEIKEVGPDYFAFEYRHSNLKGSDHLVLKVAFRLQKGCDKAKIGDILLKRREKQPPGMSGGSFFKNPGEKSAGQLIDECGLKGKTVGGAQISDKHANFILNTGNATASDILKLAEMAKKAVKDRFDIDLEEEVQVIG